MFNWTSQTAPIYSSV